MVEGIGWEVWCSHLSISLHPSILPAGALVGGLGQAELRGVGVLGGCAGWLEWLL